MRKDQMTFEEWFFKEDEYTPAVAHPTIYRAQNRAWDYQQEQLEIAKVAWNRKQDKIDELTSKLNIAIETLKFYANPENYETNFERTNDFHTAEYIIADEIRARETLEKINE